LFSVMLKKKSIYICNCYIFCASGTSLGRSKFWISLKDTQQGINYFFRLYGCRNPKWLHLFSCYFLWTVGVIIMVVGTAITVKQQILHQSI
jgi:hypothetical protein